MTAVVRTTVRRDESGRRKLEEQRGELTLLRTPPGGVRIGHLSDFHLGKPLEGGRVMERLGRWLAMMETAEADVLVVSGDLVEEPGARVDLLEVAHRLDDAGIPWVVVPGNHDVAEPGCAGAFGEFFGSYPRVERHAGVDFVLLDSFGGYPVGARTPFERLEAQSQGCYSRGRVGAEQLETAEARLRGARRRGNEERPRVLVVHHHLADEEAVTGESHRDKYPTGLMAPCRDAAAVLAWSRKMGIELALHGHIHRWWPAYVRENVVALNSGSSTRGRPRPRARLADFDAEGRLRGTWTLELFSSGAPATGRPGKASR